MYYVTHTAIITTYAEDANLLEIYMEFFDSNFHRKSYIPYRFVKDYNMHFNARTFQALRYEIIIGAHKLQQRYFEPKGVEIS